MWSFALPTPRANRSPAEQGSSALSTGRCSRLSRTISGIPLALILPVLLLGSLLVLAMPALSQEPYRQPPREVLDVLRAPTTPVASVSPARDYMLLVDTMRY